MTSSVSAEDAVGDDAIVGREDVLEAGEHAWGGMRGEAPESPLAELREKNCGNVATT